MKKQSTLKRALALGMSATMVGATLAGCGGSASSTAATSTETASSAATEAEATTDSDKPFAGTTLTWYTTLNGNVSDNFANLGDTPWAKYVEEQTGITIEFQHPTQGWRWMLLSGQIVTLNIREVHTHKIVVDTHASTSIAIAACSSPA